MQYIFTVYFYFIIKVLQIYQCDMLRLKSCTPRVLVFIYSHKTSHGHIHIGLLQTTNKTIYIQHGNLSSLCESQYFTGMSKFINFRDGYIPTKFYDYLKHHYFLAMNIILIYTFKRFMCYPYYSEIFTRLINLRYKIILLLYIYYLSRYLQIKQAGKKSNLVLSFISVLSLDSQCVQIWTILST